MARKQTPSYVLTLKLNTNNRDEAILDKRFEICRKITQNNIWYSIEENN